MADTCSINFNAKNRTTGKVEVSTLWKDLLKEFKGDRKKAIAHYLLTKDPRFLVLNASDPNDEGLGVLNLDGNGEVTIESLRNAMGYADTLERDEEDAMNYLLQTINKNGSSEHQEFSYLEALNDAIQFNRDTNELYSRKGKKNDNGTRYHGLMATLERRPNGKYSIVIKRRTRAEEEAFAKHVLNKIITDALVELLRSHGMDVKFLEESLAKMWFDPVHSNAADALWLIASVLLGEESSVEVAEAVGHFLIGAMRGTPLVERLIKMFSATEEDVKRGLTKEAKSYVKKLKKQRKDNGIVDVAAEDVEREGATMTGEQALQLVFKSGSADTNPFYREDFDVSTSNAVEAAGIVLGRQLIAPMLPAMKPIKQTKDENTGKTVTKKAESEGTRWTKAARKLASILNLIRRTAGWVFKQFNFVNKAYVNEMVTIATDRANDVVANYLDMAAAGEQLKEDFKRNIEHYGSKTIVRKSGINELTERSLKCVKAYCEGVTTLKKMASELLSLLKRAEERSGNKKVLADVMKALEEIRGHADPYINMESFAESTTRESIAMMVLQMSDILSGPVATLLQKITEVSKMDNVEKTVKDCASMRSIIAVYQNCAALLDTIELASADLDMNGAVQLEGQPATFTLREAVNALKNVLQDTGPGGLPRNIVNVMNRMTASWAKQFYGQDYIDHGAGVLWPWEANAKTKKTGGRGGLYRRAPEKIDIYEFAQSLEKDINWMDAWMFSAADSADFFTLIADSAARRANMTADRQAADWWYRLEALRPEMEELFGTTDCRIFFEEIDKSDEIGPDEKGNYMTGNLIQAGLTDEESAKDGIFYGKWERQRREFEMDLKRRFRILLEEIKQEFYKNNPGQVFYLSEMQKGVLYQKFIKPEWKRWHSEHSVRDDVSGAWIPNPDMYRNPQFDRLFPDTELGRKRLAWYRKMLAIKSEMDNMLPAGATVYVRAPQISGKLRHRYYDLRSAGNNRWDSFRRAVLREMGDKVHIRPDEAYMFGTNNEFNDIGQDPLESKSYFEKEKRQRLAFWGVNRLEDVSHLNTDLFSTLSNYGCMAATYGAMSSVVDIAELGKQVLAARTQEDKSDPNKKDSNKKAGKETRTYTRYTKFVDKGIYGLNVTPPKYESARKALKILQGLSRLGVRFMLEWNMPGGVVNASTGLVEVIKEAGAGEFFDVKTFNWAFKYYFKHVFSNWGQTLKGKHLAKMDEMSLLIRHLNMLGENKQFFKTQQYDKGLIASKLRKMGFGPNFKSWLRGIGMSFYTMGEHMMLTIPNIAMAKYRKFWIEVDDGKGGKKLKKVDMVSLYDFKDVISGTDEEIAKVRIKKDVVAFLSPLHYRDYQTINEVLKTIDELRGSGSFNPQSDVKLNISEATYSRLEELKLTLPGFTWKQSEEKIETKYNKIQQLERMLKKYQQRCIFNENEESRMMDAGIKVTGWMHGLYKTESQSRFQQEWYSNLLSRMMGYLFGMITHRYAQMHYDTTSKTDREGYMNTAAKVYWDSIASIGTDYHKGAILGMLMSGAGTGILAHWLSFYSPMAGIILSSFNIAKGLPMMIWGGEYVQEAMKNSGYLESQYRNIRRCAGTYLWISALTLIKSLLSPKFTDDDDKPYFADTSSTWKGMMYYWTSRVLREQAAFNTNLGIKDESGNFNLLSPPGLQGAADLGYIAVMGAATGIDMLDGEKDWDSLYYKNKSKGEYRKKDPKAMVKFLRRTVFGDLLYGINWFRKDPEYRRIDSMLYPGRNTNVIFRGYDAAASYDYGRRIR